MKTKTFSILFIGLSFMLNQGLIAQDNSDQVVEKMKTFSWMEGNWQGEAWYIGPDRTKNFINQNDDVIFRVDGTIITMEGTGTHRDDDTQESETVFRAFGVLTWNLQTSKYVLRAYRGGNFIDSDLVPNEDGSYSWFIDLPYGKTRYTLLHTEDGSWNEKGEFSRDNGQTWVQNFEMNLKRK